MLDRINNKYTLHIENIFHLNEVRVLWINYRNANKFTSALKDVLDLVFQEVAFYDCKLVAFGEF